MPGPCSRSASSWCGSRARAGPRPGRRRPGRPRAAARCPARAPVVEGVGHQRQGGGDLRRCTGGTHRLGRGVPIAGARVAAAHGFSWRCGARAGRRVVVPARRRRTGSHGSGGLPGGRAALGAGEAEADGAGRVWKLLSAASGRVILTTRLSALPVVSALRVPRRGVLPIDRTRGQHGGLGCRCRCRCSSSWRRPRSRGGSRRRSESCRPMVASVSSLLDVLAAVVRPMPARAWSPVLLQGDGAADGVAGDQAGRRRPRAGWPRAGGADVDLHRARRPRRRSRRSWR